MLVRHFRRIAVVNRGEPAMRVIHAVRELALETGEEIGAVALHTAAERRAPFVRDADDAVCFDDLGVPCLATTPYLDLDVLVAALHAARADAVWVGWGFVAEKPEFADLCAELGLTFIGPSGDVMRLLGDKIAAKQLAESVEVPMAPWSGGPVATAEEAVAAAERIGFPLMVKAAAGGGGRGIRRVDAPEHLASAFESARTEGGRSFGDPTVFLERVVSAARHVEVQIIADEYGTVWAPGVRDCSAQRRNQKVIEESASTALRPELVERLKVSAIRLAQAAGYRNAGTVEFLYQPEEDLLAFLEVNTRLQVEHPVTELTCGIDLVKLQVHVARGGRLEPEPPPPRGHAIEVRLNAEDPAADFAPAPGRIVTMTLPSGPGVRVDTGVGEGDAIAPEYDSMIAKVIAWGANRDEALARLQRAVSQTTVLVEGGTTNKSFLLDLLDRPEIRDGRLDTGWIDRLVASGGHLVRRDADVALVVAAIDVHDQESMLDREQFFGAAARGRPFADPEVGREVELRYAGQDHRVHVAAGGPGGWYRLTLGGDVLDVTFHRLGRGRSRLQIGTKVFAVVSQIDRTEHLVEVDGGAPLLRIRPADGDQAAPTAERLRFQRVVRPPADGREAALARIDALRALVLGYDVSEATVAGLLADHRLDSEAAGDPDVRRAELRVLRAFADLCGLTRERRTVDRDQGSHEARSPRALFNAYLRTLDPDREDLPERFRTRLLDALDHYGVRDLARTPELESALFRIHRAAQRRDAQLPVVTALLERLLDDCAGPVEAGADAGADALRDTLERVIAASQARYPAVGNLARSVRHRCIDRPVIDEARRATAEQARAVLQRLLEHPDDELVAALVNTPQPLMRVVGETDALASPRRMAVVEAITRRYYKIRELDAVRHEDGVLLTGYAHRGRYVTVAAVAGDLEELFDVLGRLALRFRRDEPSADAPSVTVVDCYLRIDPATTVHDIAGVVDLALAGADLPASVSRVAAIAASTGDDPQTHVLTFRRDQDGRFVEDVVYRDLHPMVARRLNLWRLANFEVSRLPSSDDTHIFECVARSNPADERLIAVAEVRDITPLRDATGTVVALPELERVLATCLDGLRQAQADDPRRQRLEWNRVMLFVWPPVEITLDEVTAVAKRLVPLTTDLGLEQVMVQARILTGATTGDAEVPEAVDTVFRLSYDAGSGLEMGVTDPPTEPMTPLDDYTQKVLVCRRRSLVYPYELIPLLTGRSGTFVEHDLDPQGELVPVDRAPGRNTAGVIVGLVDTPTALHPEGMTRVAVFGDPTRSMGSIAEAECRRLLAAIELAESRRVPIEWFALSAGARIAMDSGSENLDWVAAVLRRIVTFTQAGGEINVVVAGVNVGAQPYWNAEATMLMHTKGILVMTPESAMVLTGKQAIDFSGGVSADDNAGIGGHERIMGPNGQAQYWAPDMFGAVQILFSHYAHAYVAPGEPGPRRAPTSDPFDRDVRDAPHTGAGTTFTTVGDIFSDVANPDRKKPFDIRSVIRAVVDADHEVLERWTDMAEAEVAVVADAHLGGCPVCVIGVESRPLPRTGLVPADGPGSWSAGTLFPLASKKVARAINAASGNRPVVVLANLSGFDGSPESMRRLQLEYGAEIGRAIVNFEGPIVLCVVSRYHGGAFVVFSGRLNDRMEVLAVEGAHASVIGGAPAAAVVFTRDVNTRTQADPRVQELEVALAAAPPAERSAVRVELARVRSAVRNEMLGVVAAEFDAVHSVQRAQDVGSVDRIIAAKDLRPELIAAVERGLRTSSMQ